MNWFSNMAVRAKILLVAGLGIAAFLAYFVYSAYVNQATLKLMEQVEQRDLPVLELIGETAVDFIALRETFITTINEEDPDLLQEAMQQAARFQESLDQILKIDPASSDDVEELKAIFSSYVSAASGMARSMLDGSLQADSFFSEISRIRNLQSAYEARHGEFEEARHTVFRNRLKTSSENSRQTQIIGVVLGSLTLILLSLISWRVTRGITNALDYAVNAANTIASGDWDADISVTSTDETGRLLRAIRQMRDTLKDVRDEDRRQNKLKSQLASLNESIRGDMELAELGANMLSFLIPELGAQVGAFYAYDSQSQKLNLVSTYAMERRKQLSNEYALGESLVGQAALERKQILLTNVPSDYMSITSATGSGTPGNVVVTPIIHEKELKGVLEVGSLQDLTEESTELLNLGTKSIAVAVHTAESRVRLSAMLDHSRAQADELEKQKEEMARVNDDLENQAMELAASESRLTQQQEELRAINEELEGQTQALRASEESLQAQQEELRVTNEELEAQARLLSEQKATMAEKNKALELLQTELEDKIRELELSSKYKSEFLSTMSHELRTPLNSILILSNALAQNKKGNLEEKQVEHAAVIHSAGSDLLALINDILDISKIEEGKMDVIVDALSPQELGEHFRKHFTHIAENKGLYFKVDVDDGLPEHVYTDRQRLEQIIKNLLSNALKFTENGGVTLEIARVPDEERLPSRNLINKQTIRLSVKDTGIGIPKEKQLQIFEAFQQADGTTSRKYGGTGLGLTISRELARLLGGEIGIHSEGGQGSAFTLYLPFGDPDSVYDEDSADAGARAALGGASAVAAPIMAQAAASAEDGSDSFQVREKTVLIIEDDSNFARVLLELASDYGLEGHVCADGETGLEYARHYRPSAIILDIGLPGIDGWEVMDRLKDDPRTRDIPVHFLSGKDERKKALELGAIDFLTKPVNQKEMLEAFGKIEKAIEKNVRRLLVVEDSEIQHESIRELFDQKGVEITAVHSGEEALNELRSGVFDCMILDLSLPDMTGFDLLRTTHGNDEYDSVPVIIYTGKDLTRDEEAQLRKYADRIILKTERSSERLLNEASLFLHWLESSLPRDSRSSKAQAEHRDDVFEDKKLLLVDDDMRNIYALSAQLEELGFDITVANNGREALEALDESPDVDIVLMDIMMPEMDGYEAMTHIRKQDRFQNLPILALTAKAMKDDRAKCLEAGANDYCSKPLDMAKLTSLMRVWLHK